MKEMDRHSVQLSQPTAELLERYGDFDKEGYISKFQIINEELVDALKGAARWLQEGFWDNERLSEMWDKENPCACCAERESCTITCRRKHTFDKEVYGGLLCGTNPAAYQIKWGTKEVKNKVHFRVKFVTPNTLIFERNEPHISGAIKVDKKGLVRIEGKSLKLRPWSATLYTMFALHPEGFALASLAEENRKEFLKIYQNISGSEVKTSRLRLQLDNTKQLSHLLNNKLSELNSQLAEQGVRPTFLVRSEQHKANNKPYYIPYLRD